MTGKKLLDALTQVLALQREKDMFSAKTITDEDQKALKKDPTYQYRVKSRKPAVNMIDNNGIVRDGTLDNLNNDDILVILKILNKDNPIFEKSPADQHTYA